MENRANHLSQIDEGVCGMSVDKKEIALAGDRGIAILDRKRSIEVLMASHYPGAKQESVELVLDYCAAARLDPMLKPVHIVPMKVRTGKKNDAGYDIKEDRDVIMPGVGLYRTNASRTGSYAGMSEPKFGPNQEMEFTEEKWSGAQGKRTKTTHPRKLIYPDWCEITVSRILPNGQIGTWTAREFWIENYAAKGDGEEPNAMWRKRPRGQLAKCTEAQVLRKAFPEATGDQTTYEEMEGKQLDHGGDIIDHDTGEIINRIGHDLMPGSKSAKSKTEITDAEFTDQSANNEDQNAGGKPNADTRVETNPKTSDKAAGQQAKSVDGKKVTAGQISIIRHKLGQQDQFDEGALCQMVGVQKIEEIPAARVNDILTALQDAAGG